MIDFNAELLKFTVPAGTEDCGAQEPLMLLANTYQTGIARLSKEQLELGLKVEDLAESVDTLIDAREAQAAAQRQRMALVGALVRASQLLEDLLRFAGGLGNASFSLQAQSMWQAALQNNQAVGLTVFGEVGDSFDPKLHVVSDIAEDVAQPNGTLCDVLKRGYLYDGEILKKAETIVNRVESGGLVCQ